MDRRGGWRGGWRGHSSIINKGVHSHALFLRVLGYDGNVIAPTPAPSPALGHVLVTGTTIRFERDGPLLEVAGHGCGSAWAEARRPGLQVRCDRAASSPLKRSAESL